MANEEHSNVDALLAHLEKEYADEEVPMKCWAIPVRGELGYAWVEVSMDDLTMLRNGESAFEFKVVLGAVNARKLIDFLRELPAEPDDDEPPPQEQG